jgi:proteic killer suppression protein
MAVLTLIGNMTMIRTFNCKETEKIFNRERSIRFGNISRVALRKLMQIDAASELNDLRVPPGNRLEALVGDRKGQHSIRINDQWRICFKWINGDAFDVEITDYH